jgi:hypothetical protein
MPLLSLTRKFPRKWESQKNQYNNQSVLSEVEVNAKVPTKVKNKLTNQQKDRSTKDESTKKTDQQKDKKTIKKEPWKTKKNLETG